MVAAPRSSSVLETRGSHTQGKRVTVLLDSETTTSKIRFSEDAPELISTRTSSHGIRSNSTLRSSVDSPTRSSSTLGESRGKIRFNARFSTPDETPVETPVRSLEAIGEAQSEYQQSEYAPTEYDEEDEYDESSSEYEVGRRRSLTVKDRVDRHLKNLLCRSINEHCLSDAHSRRQSKWKSFGKSVCFAGGKSVCFSGGHPAQTGLPGAMAELTSALPQRKSGGQSSDKFRRGARRWASYGSTLRDVTPYERFKRIATRVRIIAKVCLTFRLYVAETHGEMTLHHMEMSRSMRGADINTQDNAESEQKQKQDNFDVADFKCYTEFKFPRKGRIICELEPEQRTPLQVEQLRRLMLTIDAFRTYPAKVQTLLCKRLRYETYMRRRLIVRRGHVATCMYFIFSGSIGVTKGNQSAETVFTDSEPIVLRKGLLFGDIALINNDRRNASIVVMECAEFLVVDRHDFDALHLFDYHNREFNGRLTFFRDNPLLRYCSNDYISSLAGGCKNEWSIHNQVVVRDSTKTNNIYFVKSGRLSVVRLVQLDSCNSFKRHLTENGAFPALHTLGQTLRSCSHNDEATYSVDRKVKKLLVPEINCAVYLQVDQLQAGDCFGLNTLMYPDDRVFTLISEGCELLRLSKGQVQKNKDIARVLKRNAVPYPSDEELCKIFMAMNHWRFYRSAVAKKAIDATGLFRHGQAAAKNSGEIGSWMQGCIKMPWDPERSTKSMSQYLTLADTRDARGEYWPYRDKKMKTLGCPHEDRAATRRQGALHEDLKWQRERNNENTRETINLDKYCPSKRAEQMKKQVGMHRHSKYAESVKSPAHSTMKRAEQIKSQVEKMERDVISRIEKTGRAKDKELDDRHKIGMRLRKAVDQKGRHMQKARDRTSGADSPRPRQTGPYIARLIQGIDLPTFKIQSFA